MISAQEIDTIPNVRVQDWTHVRVTDAAFEAEGSQLIIARIKLWDDPFLLKVSAGRCRPRRSM